MRRRMPRLLRLRRRPRAARRFATGSSSAAPASAARSLIFAFNDPVTNEDKKPLPFDKDDPFKELGIRLVGSQGAADPVAPIQVTDVVLTKAEFSGLSGMQQMFKNNKSIGRSSSNDAD